MRLAMRMIAIRVILPVLVASAVCGTQGWADPPASGKPAEPRTPARQSNVIEPNTGIAWLRFEPTGLSLLRPYERGKIPVVLVHGLWSNPWSWARMIEALEAEPEVHEKYQFWTFGYSTGEPILYSAYLLRQALIQARKTFDPMGADPAFMRMVVVGHSMGGLLANAMVQDSGLTLWQGVANEPVEKLAGPDTAREMLRGVFFYTRVPEVRRVVFIATPHRGSHLDRGAINKVGSRLIKHLDPLQESYSAVLKSNSPDFFKEPFRRGLATSVDQLAWEHPRLVAIMERGIDPAVKHHSIIADRRDPPRAGGTDGVVPYASAHLDGALSEMIVQGSHFCQDRPLVIKEVQRILMEHLQ